MYVPCVAVRLALRTALGMWMVTIKPSTVFPMVCLGPIVMSRRPHGPVSKKLMLCFTYTGMATRLRREMCRIYHDDIHNKLEDSRQLLFTS